MKGGGLVASGVSSSPSTRPSFRSFSWAICPNPLPSARALSTLASASSNVNRPSLSAAICSAKRAAIMMLPQPAPSLRICSTCSCVSSVISTRSAMKGGGFVTSVSRGTGWAIACGPQKHSKPVSSRMMLKCGLNVVLSMRFLTLVQNNLTVVFILFLLSCLSQL